MIDKAQLRKIHSQDLPLHILEQDYIQAIFLSELYSESENLVFKGGTFLKHAHGLDRFSEDLDFTATDNKILPTLKTARKSLEDYGIEADIDNVEETENSLLCRLQYRGPLYTGDQKSLGSIEIEVSKRDDIINSPEWTRMFFEYPETRVVNALGLNKEELLAEKLRALTTRTKARDLYDTWFMIKQGTEPVDGLFKKKMEEVNQKPVIKIDLDRENWRRDLEILLENPPNHNDVEKHVLEKLGQKGFQIET